MIRARIDRHSLWHPREDYEYEAESMQEICNMLSADVEKEINFAINSNQLDGSNPLAMRFAEWDGKPRRTKWRTANTVFDIKAEVLITAVRREEGTERQPVRGRRKVKTREV